MSDGKKPGGKNPGRKKPRPKFAGYKPGEGSVKKRSRPDRGEPSATPEKRSRPAREKPSATPEKRSRPAREKPSATPEKRNRPAREKPSATPEKRSRPARADAAPEPRRRLALSHQGGSTRVHGDSDACDILREAFETAANESADRLTHNIHGYPARMHPAIARTLLANLSRPDDQLLDPFCGSGTTLVEARVAGMFAAGVDLNPLGLRVAEVKTQLRSAQSRSDFLVQLNDLAMRSEERVRDREPVVAPVPRHHVRWYAGHILKELGGLWEEIRTVPREDDRRAFELLLSSLVMKFSYRRSESDDRGVERKLRKGLVTEHFHRRGLGLVERWAELEEAAPPDSPAPWLVEGDARRLPRLLGPPARADLVITSPPYGGTYDYVAHHELRYPWLGLDPQQLERYEVGARRNLSSVGAVGRWERELLEVMRALAEVMVPRAVAVLLVGDAQLDGERVAADRQLRDVAERSGFSYIASASQPRPDFTGHGTRQEHLVLLERSGYG
ncbi:MAG: hypothetical protein GXP55_13095 [Deltaproteobacteria bacterium]|nr:hypothetical protein [Deltaproteobacteria bacterium]